jgi:hypothetical protein
MFHLEAYSSSIATGTTLHQVTAIKSQVYPPAGNGFLVQSLNKIMMTAHQGVTAIRAQLQSASLRKQPFIDLVPVNIGAAFESPVRFADFTMAPLQVFSNEELDYFASQSHGSGEVETAGVWFTDGNNPSQINKPNLTVHATASVTLSALAWTTVAFSLDTSLDPGTYAIIGARCYSATGLLFRVIPNSGGQVYRPGMTMVQVYDALDHPYARNGYLGQWATFSTTNLPSFELFATSADTAEELWLDLVQTSANVIG